MANVPSAQKRNRQRLKRRTRNLQHLVTMRTKVKRARQTLTDSKADAATMKRAAVAAGMRTLRGDGAGKVLAGITSIEEVMLVTAEDKS